MKNKMTKILVGTLVALSSTQAFAAFNVEELHIATKAAVSELTKAAPEHVAHISGYKTWISAEDAKVKLYISHDGMNMEFNYLCNRHPGSIDCHVQ